MSSFQPPPTWALPVLVDEKTGVSTFNPIWLKWFIELSANLSSSGAGSGGINETGGVTNGHIVQWANSAGTLVKDGGVLGTAAHSATSAFDAAGAANTVQSNLNTHAALVGAAAHGLGTISTQAASAVTITGGTVAGVTINSSSVGATTPSTVKGTTVQASTAGGFIASDASTGITTTITTGSLVGKTITVTDGLIVGFV